MSQERLRKELLRARLADGRRDGVPPSQNHAQSLYEGEKERERGKSWEYDGGDEGPREGKGEKDNDEIPFCLQDRLLRSV